MVLDSSRAILTDSWGIPESAIHHHQNARSAHLLRCVDSLVESPLSRLQLQTSGRCLEEVKLPMLTETGVVVSAVAPYSWVLAANVGGTIARPASSADTVPFPKPHSFLGLRGALLHALLKSHPSVHRQAGASRQPQWRGQGKGRAGLVPHWTGRRAPLSGELSWSVCQICKTRYRVVFARSRRNRFFARYNSTRM
jgi:hypothetical protein